MNITDEILTCANQLANAGKKPTVALVKAKLTQKVPLATLITTLKNWQHQPDFITANNTDTPVNEKIVTKDSAVLIEPLLNALLANNDAIEKMIQQSLAAELITIKHEISEIKSQVNSLTEQLTKK